MSELKRLEEKDWEILDELEDSIKEYNRATDTYFKYVSDDIGVDDEEYYNEDYGDGEDSPYELAVWVSETRSNIEYVLDEIKSKGYSLEKLREENKLIDDALNIIEEE